MHRHKKNIDEQKSPSSMESPSSSCNPQSTSPSKDKADEAKMRVKSESPRGGVEISPAVSPEPQTVKRRRHSITTSSPGTAMSGNGEVVSSSLEQSAASATPVTILGQIFPGRSRSSLESVLLDCQGDLVKALEVCAKTSGNNVVEERPPQSHLAPPPQMRRSPSQAVNRLFRPHDHQPSPWPNKIQDINGNGLRNKMTSASFGGHKSAFSPTSHPYYRSAAAAAAAAAAVAASSGAATSSSPDIYSALLSRPSAPPPTSSDMMAKELFPFPPPPFFPPSISYLSHVAAATSPLSHFMHRSPLLPPPPAAAPPTLSLGSSPPPNTSKEIDFHQSSCSDDNVPKVDSTESLSENGDMKSA